MLYPTINELTKGSFNRYELALATARCARIVTDEYSKQRDDAEKSQSGKKEADKRPIYSMIDKELADDKAVRVAIKRIHTGEFVIVRRPEGYVPVVEEPVVEEPVVEEPVVEEPIAEEPQPAQPVAIIEETPAEQIQNADLVEAETIHVAFLQKICQQFDADELEAHVKVTYKKKREKKTSVFDVIMKKNRP